MTNDDYITDYQINKLVKIRIWGFDFYVTPRFTKLYVDRLYEPVSMRLVLALLKKSSKDEVWIDAGAHYGIYSLLAATRYPSIETIAVEPMAENIAIIKHNLKDNGLKNLELVEAAISATEGEKEIRVAHASDSSSFAPHPTGKKIGTRIIPTTTIDKISKGKIVALIKLDVEGHELPALYGAVKVIKKDQPSILFEYHHQSQKLAGFGKAELLEFLINKEYQLWAVSEDQEALIELDHSPTLAHQQALKAFGHEGYGNILALSGKEPTQKDIFRYPIPGSTNKKLRLEDTGIGLINEVKGVTDWNLWWLQHERHFYKQEFERVDWEVKEFKKKWAYRVGQSLKRI